MDLFVKLMQALLSILFSVAVVVLAFVLGFGIFGMLELIPWNQAQMVHPALKVRR